jgi:signal transduction histidine kinase
MGASACFDERHLKSNLLGEVLGDALESIQIRSELKKAQLEISEMKMDEWDRREKLERERQALLSLARYKFSDGSFKVGLSKVARLCLEMMAVDRVSIWLARRVDARLHFVVGESLSDHLSDGVLLEEGESSQFLEELDRGEPMAMATLKGLSLYQRQSAVLLNGEQTALVDVPIFFNGQVQGLLRAEQADGPRDWQMENLNFMDALADVVSLALEQEERLKVTSKLKSKEDQYLRQLERRNEELQEFASVVSHDLQEPLYKVKAFGSVLLTQHAKQMNDEARFIVERMADSGSRMSRLICDLLTYSKISSQDRPMEPVNLRSLIKEVLEDLELRIAEKDAVLEIDDLPMLTADALQMRQLFQNMLSNALKFSKNDVKTIIEIRYRKDPKGLIFSILDNGIGFNPQHVDKVFGVFQRSGDDPERKGTGVGLAIAKKIVLYHGGSIEVKTELDKGCCFEICFPLEMLCQIPS